MPHVTRLRVISASVASTALIVGGLSMATAAQATPRKAIAGTHPQWATSAHRVARPDVASSPVSARVYLASRDAAGLTAFDTAVSTPGNALYRHFLTPAQMQARFGATAAQVKAVESWLRGAGLSVTSVHNQAAGSYIAVRGSTAAASKAFAVTFGAYRKAGAVVRAPEQAATAPASVAASVLTVSGLSTARATMRPQAATKLPPPDPNFWVAHPCNAYYGQKTATSKPKAYGKHWSWAVCGYTPPQVRGAYGVAGTGLTGKGQTVAVVDAYASPTMHGDANKYARHVGDKPFRPGQYRQFTPGSYNSAVACDAPGWYGEETLDVESVHGMAPDAKVRYVAGASCNDSDLADALAKIVNHHLASIVSNSWGDTEDADPGLLNVYDLIFRAGTAEGISFFFSSGDSGYEDPAAEDSASDRIQVDYPTSDPWVTSVGGTSLAIGAHRNYRFETSWGTISDPLSADGKSWSSPPPGTYPDDYAGSGGGGTSTLFAQPAYQKGTVPNSLSQTLPGGKHSATKMRVVPDVSAYGDPATGFAIGQTTLQPDGKTFKFSLSRIGGTSLSCPTMAGIEADAQQAAGGALGFANPVLYAVHHLDGKAFHDVTDHPRGAGHIAQVRADYTDPTTKQKPLVFKLRTLGINGEGAAALPAVRGYDDATGVGSPWQYLKFVELHG